MLFLHENLIATDLGGIRIINVKEDRSTQIRHFQKIAQHLDAIFPKKAIAQNQNFRALGTTSSHTDRHSTAESAKFTTKI
jgi:hypothetical protein